MICLAVLQDAALSHPAVKEFCTNNKTNCRTLTVNVETVTDIKEMMTIDKDKSDSSHLTIDPVDIGLRFASSVFT